MSSFAFKQFTIDNGECAMKVGTDGTLLGAWAKGGQTILDIGTGTGLIALMMAQRYADAQIKAIDISKECCLQAQRNIDTSPFGDRISVEHTSIESYAETADMRFDSIVSNPPFFVNALVSPSESRRLARHSDSMPYDKLFAAVDRLLTSEGTFSAIIPSESFIAFASEASLKGLIISRRCDISTVSHKTVSRHLIEFRRHQAAISIESHYLCNKDGSRSEWYEALTKDFYKW